MSIDFGVGDIITLTAIIVKMVEDIHDAPEELRDLAGWVGTVENLIESTHEKLTQNAPERIMSHLVILKDRVTNVLSAMRDIVTKDRDKEGRVNPFHRAMYSVWDKREIAKFVTKLEEQANYLTDLLPVQTWDSTDQIRPLIE